MAPQDYSMGRLLDKIDITIPPGRKATLPDYVLKVELNP